MRICIVHFEEQLLYFRKFMLYFHIIYASPPLSMLQVPIKSMHSYLQRQYFRWGTYRLIMYASNVIANPEKLRIPLVWGQGPQVGC